MEGSDVKLINQPLLPHKFEIFTAKDHKETASAIKTMVVRGAGAIGAAAAYGVAQAALEADGNLDYINNAIETLKSTRPTAQNLFTGIDYVNNAIKDLNDINEIKELAVKKANEFADYDSDSCKKIGEFGNSLIKDNSNIMTHCNAGWLAFVDWGTANSPLFAAHKNGKKIHVYISETRPRNQGSRLTAWEMVNENIPHSVIVDNASGHYMKQGKINLLITGADRIAANGDVANKIGTYQKAVLAKENNIPFYVAAPTTTFDLNCEDGSKIPIEERHEEEVSHMFGLNDKGEISKVRIAPKESSFKNPAFDVTPAKYITGIITEKGIIKANSEDIKKLFSSN